LRPKKSFLVEKKQCIYNNKTNGIVSYREGFGVLDSRGAE